MAARVQNSTSLRLGLFHTWKTKNIFVKKILLEKYNTNHNDYLFSKLIMRILSTYKMARTGFIPGRAILRNYLIRKNKTKKDLIKLSATFFDVLVQDTYWKKRWKVRKYLLRHNLAYKYLSHNLRFTLLKLLKKRLSYGLKIFFNIEQTAIKCTFPGFSLKNCSASFLVNYITRRLIIRFNLFEIIPGYMWKLKRYFTGVLIDCFGRFTRRQRAHFMRFKFGINPLNSFYTPIDYRRKHCKLKYGVGNIKVWVCKFKRTLRSHMDNFRRMSYILDLRQMTRDDKTIKFNLLREKRLRQKDPLDKTQIINKFFKKN